jgi:predicted nuclease of predicted toxin-antitoxin system
MTRFFLDENCTRALAAELAAQGHDALMVADTTLRGGGDEKVLQLARTQGRVLITQDLWFGDVRVNPPGSHPGVVLCRIPSTVPLREQTALVARAVGMFTAEEIAGSLITVRTRRVRRNSP